MSDDQLTIDFLPEINVSRGDFVLGSCNALAADWIDRWPDWPGRIRGLVIHGPADCGKSHLGEIWKQASHAAVLDKIDANTLESIDADSNLLLDHPAPGEGPGEVPGEDWPENDFFHLLNRLAGGEGSVLILSRWPMTAQSMGMTGWRLADLSSRLAGLAAAEITPPDDAMLVAVMQKHADDLGFALDGDTARYIATRMERSFHAARQIIQKINIMALRRKKKVNLAMVRDILDQNEPRLL